MFGLDVGFLNSLPWEARSFIFDLIKAFILNTQISDEQLSVYLCIFLQMRKKNQRLRFFLFKITRLVESYVKGDEADFYNLVISWVEYLKERFDQISGP